MLSQNIFIVMDNNKTADDPDWFKNYMGKSDRKNLNVPSHDPIVVSLEPKTPTQQLLKNINKEINECMDKTGSLSIPWSDAISWYLNARMLRHDNMCDFITESLTIQDAKVGDTKLSDFCERYNICKIAEIPAAIASKTPDILLMDKASSCIFLGDVTITNSVKMSIQRKHEKYILLVDFLREKGFLVNHIDCIFKSDRSNINQVTLELSNSGLIKINQGTLDVYNCYFELANSIMFLCRNYNDSPIEFNAKLDSTDMVKPSNLILPNVPEHIIKALPPPYKPKMSEPEIINMIKNEVDKYDLSAYFNSDINQSLKTIDSIINDNITKEHSEPKSTLQVVYNTSDIEVHTDLDLTLDYLKDIRMNDQPVADYMRYILPSDSQIKQMKRFKNKNNKIDVKTDQDLKECNVYGPYQYKIGGIPANFQISEFNYRMSKGKKNKNIKSEPKSINLAFLDKYSNDIDITMSYLGQESAKPSMFNDDWDCKTNFEFENTKYEYEVMKYVKSTNGAQLAHSMAMLYDRFTHLSIKQSQVDNIFIPPNGSFICIIPHQHAPMTAKNVDLPMVFIARCNKSKTLQHIEYEHSFEGEVYRYYISKPCRLNIERLSNWTNASCKVVASSSYILSRCRSLNIQKDMLIGMLTVLTIDSHQKVSEFTDLLKYISYMPFSQVHKLPDLIREKMDLMIKTRLDAWMLKKLKNFIIELSKIDLLNASKPKLKTFNTNVMSESLGLEAALPSFVCPDIRHTNPSDFIEEMNIIHCCRAKHLYGSQFMDKSITNTVDWNIEYIDEVNKYGGWATDGIGDGNFPFESKFCFSADAIYYANNELNARMGITPGKVETRLHSSGYARFMHENCSLRGCTKEMEDRDNQIDIHTTSMDACLQYYKKIGYNDEKGTSNYIAYDALINGRDQHFSMSEKDQRGGGRPIATPTLSAKAVLMMIEKPEQARGRFMTNNIIVPNINKAQAQCEAYKRAISDGIRLKYTKIYQLTEDQTKFSENDNVNKYLVYLRTNLDVDPSIRSIQYAALLQLHNRVHCVKRLPIDVTNSQERLPYVVNTPNTLGVKAIIGWPQGMLNCISTNVHAGADIWITKAYNIAYPDNKVHTVGLVHSDDSWVTVCCNSEEDFKRYALFRIVAKKLFCLKLNIKKLWGSGMMGELVSNYNLNGNVHLSVAKIIPNSFGNLNYQNWVMDVHNQVSVLQQCYRNGANLGTITMLATILKQQILHSYQVKGLQLKLLHELPVDIGGYPDVSPFELAVAGLPASYRDILDKMKREPGSEAAKIIKVCLHWSIKRIVDEEQIIVSAFGNNTRRDFYTKLRDSYNDKWSDDDYENLVIPSKGDIFRCIRHIMPKSRKLAKTVSTIRNLPFESNGLEMLVTRPKTLAEGLGHLKARASNMLYELAADKYTQNARRLAISQAIQSSGKVIKIGNLCPMSFNEFYTIALNSITPELSTNLISDAFDETNELVSCTKNIVYQSNHMRIGNDKRQVLSRMPIIDTKFRTISPLRDVLLRIIDMHMGTNYVEQYSKLDVALRTLDDDARLIVRRFESYFNCHNIVTTCNLIMQQFLSVTRSRLWTQPHLRNETLLVFLEDLYGKTINSSFNFSIVSSVQSSRALTTDVHTVQTLYNTCVLNNLYPGKFTMLTYDDRPISNVISQIDYKNFDDNDMCKYAVIQSIINKNDDFFKQMYNNNVYRQFYIVKQNYSPVYRRYSGYFKCVCTMGSTVIEISGEPEVSIELKSNTTAVNSILNIMKIFIERNFRYERYMTSGLWGTKQFWKYVGISKGPYLCYHNQYSTVISPNPSWKSIPIEIDANLMFVGQVDNFIPTKYTISESLREIFYLTPNDEKRRLASIHQNFSLPHRNHITLEPASIQQLDTSELYASGVMESLIMNDTKYINSAAIERLLLKSPYGQLSSMNVIVSFLKLLSKAMGVNLTMPDIKKEVDNVVYSEELIGYTPEHVWTTYESQSPEDLSAVYVELAESQFERIGRLHVIKDLKRALAKAYIGAVTDDERDSFIKCLLIDDRIKQWYSSIKKQDGKYLSFEEIIHDLEEMSVTPVNIKLYSFITELDLDTQDGWDKINLGSINNNVATDNIKPHVRELAKSYVKFIAETVFEEEYQIQPEISILDL
uniref:RNA-directed RNA polymerase L n=1 Tax=Apis bunyavirus 2 TaxID=1983566 RepID=A0A1W6R6I9_9VIRU|nr:RNA-dependent RNA polymerase [Apis bunyavirus 2]